MTHEWDDEWAGVRVPTPMGPDAGYEAAAEWVAGLRVEDWGCGGGYLRNFIEPGLYRGVDGSDTPFAHVEADLAEYTPDEPPEAIVMRGVLEHNDNWMKILTNACAHFTERMAVVLFTPLVQRTRLIRMEPNGAPTYSFRLGDIIGVLEEHMLFKWHVEIITDPMVFDTEFNYETLIGVER